MALVHQAWSFSLLCIYGGLTLGLWCNFQGYSDHAGLPIPREDNFRQTPDHLPSHHLLFLYVDRTPRRPLCASSACVALVMSKRRRLRLMYCRDIAGHMQSETFNEPRSGDNIFFPVRITPQGFKGVRSESNLIEQ